MARLKRGDILTIAVTGDYGKPRPALLIQADAFHAIGSVTVLRLTSDLHDHGILRILVNPSLENGLRRPSQVMIDRAVSLPRDKVGVVCGRLDPETMSKVNQALISFLGLTSLTR